MPGNSFYYHALVIISENASKIETKMGQLNNIQWARNQTSAGFEPTIFFILFYYSTTKLGITEDLNFVTLVLHILNNFSLIPTALPVFSHVLFPLQFHSMCCEIARTNVL